MALGVIASVIDSGRKSGFMAEKSVLKVFISSTYRDLKEVRGLLIKGIEEALEAVAMEKFVPTDRYAHDKALEELEKSDICIFIIGDYYGTVIKNCTRKNECGDCKGDISFTHCEYRRTVLSGRPHLVYIVENEISDVLSKIRKFDLKNVDENEIYNFLKRNGIDTSNFELFSGYTLAEIKELWKIARDKNKKKLSIFKKDITASEKGPKSYSPLMIRKKKDYFEFHGRVRKNLKGGIVEWYKDKRVRFAGFAGRREELEEFLDNLQKERSVCVVGTGGVGKTSLIQVGLLLEKLSGRKVYALLKEYSYKYTRAGYPFAKGKFCEDTFSERLTLTDIVKLVFQEDETLKSVLRKDGNKKSSLLMEELDREGSVLFVDDLQDADEDVKQFVYRCGNNLRAGAVVAGAREKGNCYSTVGPLSGLKGKDLEEMIRILAETHSTDKYVKDNLDVWCREVLRITQGHPMLVDIMVKNAQHFPDFEKLKGITGVTNIEDQDTVNEVIDRLIRDILTDREREALTILSVFHLPVDKKILDAVGGEKVVHEIIDKGFLDWVDRQLVFTFDAVRELLEAKAPLECHEVAVKYYSGKLEESSEVEKPDIYVEIVYHLIKWGKGEEASKMYFDINEILERARGRAVEVSRLLLESIGEEEKRAFILGTLGNLLLKGREFSGVEDCYLEILDVYRRLAQKDPTAYESYVATTLNNLGNLYRNLRDFKKAEDSYTEALQIRRRLAQKDPTAYESYVAMTLNNLGTLYSDLRDFKKAEDSYTEALQIRRRLAQKDPTAYESYVAMTLNNLGNLYSDLRDFKKAEDSYTEALQIRRRLAQKDPTAYESDVAMTLNNLGNLYSDLRDFKKAEKSYTEALQHKDSLPDNGARIYLGLATLAEETQKENAYQLYFTAGVISFNVLAIYGLPSIDILSCFQKTQELSPTSSPLKKMAQIVIASISKIMNTPQPPILPASLPVDDLPKMCQAVATLLLKGETTPVEEPKDDTEHMFYILYQQLRNLQ